MSAGLWFFVASLLVAICLFAIGGIRLGLAALSLTKRAHAVKLPQLDLDGARTAISRLNNNLSELGPLLARARAALEGIEDAVRSMMSAFSRE